MASNNGLSHSAATVDTTPLSASTVPTAAASTHDLKNVKAALSCVNIGRVLEEICQGGSNNELLRLIGPQVPTQFRKRALIDLRAPLRRIQHVYAICWPKPQAAFNLLLKSLCAVLEQHAAYQPGACHAATYKAEIKVLKDELQTLVRGRPACQDPQGFLDMIARWEILVKEATALAPDAMDAEQTSTEDTAWNPPMNAVVETADQRAGKMDSEPTSAQVVPRVSTPEDDIDLSEEEVKALHPERPKSAALSRLPYTLRRQALAYMCKRVKRMNLLAKQKAEVFLQDNQIPLLTHMMEKNILKDMQHDIKDVSAPTPEQIESEYGHRVEKQYEECGVFQKFLRKVKKFHFIFQDIVAWAKKKASNLSSCGHGHQQQKASSSPIDHANARKELLSALYNSISGLNVNISHSHNNGQPILRSNQIEDMSTKLEQVVVGELNKKIEQAPMNGDQQLAEYIGLGNDLLGKLNNSDFFITTVQEYFAMQA
ncbi:hypothetical protein N0V83_007665 [Neocucurbitaria cava]|uniref:Uncharacterized protein n=1 Tax=Neocucurbitaria cava TaxID=798079 RepID=A0A9W8Y4V0_9PLEO|nr:hypothetical protein N0V83_007665 [Neocucurbitaria cava]